jgi:hypothetical protein
MILRAQAQAKAHAQAARNQRKHTTANKQRCQKRIGGGGKQQQQRLRAARAMPRIGVSSSSQQASTEVPSSVPLAYSLPAIVQ